MTLDAEEWRHAVLCTVMGSFPRKTQLDVQLFLGYQSQPVTATTPQEMDKETVIATNATWKFTVILERFGSGKQLVCKGTMNFTGVHSIRVNVSASAEGQEAPDNEEKLGTAAQAAIAVSVVAPALLSQGRPLHGTILHVLRWRTDMLLR